MKEIHEKQSPDWHHREEREKFFHVKLVYKCDSRQEEKMQLCHIKHSVQCPIPTVCLQACLRTPMTPSQSPNAHICKAKPIMTPFMHTRALQFSPYQYAIYLRLRISHMFVYRRLRSFRSTDAVAEPYESSAYTWYAIIIIHSRNTQPTNSNAHAAVQLWPAIRLVSISRSFPSNQRGKYLQMLCCSKYASEATLGPEASAPFTYRLQFPFTLPVGPHSSMEMTISPTIHSTNSMKEPITTIPGSSCRWDIRYSIMKMNRIERAETVIQ
jgi:hypothetical protein